MIIDTHIHIIVDEITQEITKDPWSPITGYDDYKPFVEFQGKRLSSVINEFVDIEIIMSKQAKAGVDISVLSPWSSLFRYDSDVRTCQTVNRIQNDAIAAIADKYKNQIIGLGMVPMQDAGVAVSELKYCIDIGLRGVEIGTNINGKYLGDANFRPFWSKAEELGAVVQIHPVPGLGGPTNKEYYLWNAFSNPAETALTASHMILSGLMEEYPELKIQLFHAGGHLPYQIGRLDRAYEMRKETSKKITRKPSEYLKMFYFDTIIHSSDALDYLINLVGPEQVMLGSDYPFDMGSYQFNDLLDEINISEADREKIKSENAERLFQV
jgi:aminocarboxymuconate-semialdehyde decarboxylase|tara:strand:+ start:658 stop:1632 length:975 start_codon:yes stop_codon:yes gene_type:complete